MRTIGAVATACFSLLLSPGIAQSQDIGEVEAGADEIPAVFAQNPSRYRLGTARLFTNDRIGDGEDRWRTGSLTSSRAYGYGWDGAAPTAFGDLLELRIQGQIISPESLRDADPEDRPWAGSLSVGVHSHMTYQGAEFALGADLVVIGPQTHLDDFQDWFHDLVSAPRPTDEVLDMQIGNTIRPSVVAEVGKSYDLGSALAVRPFAELRAGDENLGRIGADLTFGLAGRGELLVRESVTGQRYRVVRNDAPTGLSFTFGGDVAYVDSSVYLPESRGYTVEDTRSRLRAGVSWESEKATLFYGLTYLDEEFEGQRKGQFTGSLRVRVSF